MLYKIENVNFSSTEQVKLIHCEVLSTFSYIFVSIYLVNSKLRREQMIISNDTI